MKKTVLDSDEQQQNELHRWLLRVVSKRHFVVTAVIMHPLTYRHI
jgi:acetolactate synthase regulatory subunit